MAQNFRSYVPVPNYLFDVTHLKKSDPKSKKFIHYFSAKIHIIIIIIDNLLSILLLNKNNMAPKPNDNIAISQRSL